MAYLLIEGAASLVAGILFVLTARRIWVIGRDKPLETRRATIAYSFLWGTAAGGSFMLALANLAAVMEWRTLDNVFSAASALAWGMAVIPFFYMCGYLVLHGTRSASAAAVCGVVIYGLGAWLAYHAPKVPREVAPLYTMHIVDDPLARIYVLCATILPGIVASVFLYLTTWRLEGIGRWRGLMGTVAMDVYIISMLARVAWQSLAANLISRGLLLASALLIFWAYYLPPRGPDEGGGGPQGREE